MPASIPDILVVDIRLPGMDGVELIATLKPRFKDLPILVLTMYEESDLISAPDKLVERARKSE